MENKLIVSVAGIRGIYPNPLSPDIVYKFGLAFGIYADGKKVFVVDKSSEITGLHEAVKLLKPGGKANLVIPSHLAYGVAGDGHRIIGQKSVAMKISIEKFVFFPK